MFCVILYTKGLRLSGSSSFCLYPISFAHQRPTSCAHTHTHTHTHTHMCTCTHIYKYKHRHTHTNTDTHTTHTHIDKYALTPVASSLALVFLFLFIAHHPVEQGCTCVHPCPTNAHVCNSVFLKDLGKPLFHITPKSGDMRKWVLISILLCCPSPIW